MEESNLSNEQNNISNVNNQILFLYHTEIQGLPQHIIYHNISTSLDDIVPKYNHIIIQDLCDFYNEADVPGLLFLITQKMTHGSKLEIQGIDIRQLCVALINNDIDEKLVKNILYSRKNILTMHSIENYFNDIGLSIYNRKYINIFEYNIIGIK